MNIRGTQAVRTGVCTYNRGGIRLPPRHVDHHLVEHCRSVRTRDHLTTMLPALHEEHKVNRRVLIIATNYSEEKTLKGRRISRVNCKASLG